MVEGEKGGRRRERNQDGMVELEDVDAVRKSRVMSTNRAVGRQGSTGADNL